MCIKGRTIRERYEDIKDLSDIVPQLLNDYDSNLIKYQSEASSLNTDLALAFLLKEPKKS